MGLNAASIRGFLSIDDSDLFLFPDPKTLTILPWRPSDGKVARFFCSIRHQDGRPFEGDVRTILKEYEKLSPLSEMEFREQLDRILPGWRAAAKLLADRAEPYSLQ